MENIAIKPKHIFGLKADTHGSIFHLDEHRVIYTAGHNVVVYKIEDRQMDIYSAHEGTLGISCISLCPKRRFLAVAEKAERAVIFIYDLVKQRKKRPLVTTDCLSNEYVSMSFAPKQESKFIVTMGGAPDWTLVFWQWDRQKVLYATKVSTGTPVYEISFNLHDYVNGIIATGNNIFKWFKPVEGQLRAQNTGIERKEAHISNNFVCHSWLHDGKLVVGTDLGEILFFDQNCEYKTFLTSGMESWSALRIVPYLNGFLVAGEESRVVVFEKNTEDLRIGYARSERTLCVPSQPTAKVKGLSISPSEDTIVLTLDNEQIYSLAFSSERDEPETLSDLFHTSGITGLDVCIRKNLVATCGHDNSIRIWNYYERKLEVVEFFNEEPYSIAFHPSGFHLVAGFSDKLRMMNIFEKSIKTYKELHIKACREVRFSHGGHLFAATNNHLVQVFNFYTGENPPHMQFKGHSGKVASLDWNEDDTVLTSTGWDGAIFEWQLYAKGLEQGSTPKFFRKGVKFSSVIATTESNPEGKLLYLAGNDKEIKEIEGDTCLRALETGSLIGHICLTNSNKLLLAAISEPEKTGAVRAYEFEPFTGEYSEYEAHSEPIERIRVSYDDSYLFTAGADGCLIIFDIKDKDTRALKREKEGFGLVPAEEILFTKAEIEALNNEFNNLIATSRELETNNKLEYDMAIEEKQEEIDKLKSQIDEEFKQEKQRYDSLFRNKQEMEDNYKERIDGLKHEFELDKQEIKQNFSFKFNKEVERYQELSKERELKARENTERMERLKSEHTRVMGELQEKFRKDIEKIRQEIERLNRENENQQEQFEKRRQRLEEINERQLFELRETNIKEIQGIKFECDAANAELELAKKIEDKYKEEKNKKAKEVDEMDRELDHQREIIKQQSEDMKTTQKEIKVRKKTIKEKEKRIYELSKKSQELSKFKFVLDYKIRELKRDIGPREDEISRLNEQTNEMEKEIKHLESVNEKLGILVENLRLKQEGMQNEINSQTEKLNKNHTKIQAYQSGIYEAVQYIQEEKKLKEAVLNLYEKFVRNETETKGPNTEKEYVRQCNHLESTISGLRRKLKKVHKGHHQDLVRIMGQNVELINEINGLRKELKFLNYLKRQVEILNQKGAKKVPHEEITKREIELQREEIMTLRKRLNELENE